MKTLVKHLLTNNLDEILAKSILNCHCIGLHSIMLLESAGKTIRLYIADDGHMMHKNLPASVESGEPMTISFHPHHCNLTLHCIKGEFVNWEMIDKGDNWGIELDKFEYQSKIKEGEIAFKPLGKSCLQSYMVRLIRQGDHIMMHANDIHTVGVEKNTFAAWLVYEGIEDEDYKSYCWSNTDVNDQDFSGLYTKPTYNDILTLLIKCGLID